MSRRCRQDPSGAVGSLKSPFRCGALVLLTAAATVQMQRWEAGLQPSLSGRLLRDVETGHHTQPVATRFDGKQRSDLRQLFATPEGARSVACELDPVYRLPLQDGVSFVHSPPVSSGLGPGFGLSEESASPCLDEAASAAYTDALRPGHRETAMQLLPSVLLLQLGVASSRDLESFYARTTRQLLSSFSRQPATAKEREALRAVLPRLRQLLLRFRGETRHTELVYPMHGLLVALSCEQLTRSERWRTARAAEALLRADRSWDDPPTPESLEELQAWPMSFAYVAALSWLADPGAPPSALPGGARLQTDAHSARVVFPGLVPVPTFPLDDR